MKKSLILIIFLINLFLFRFAFGDAGMTSEVIVHQLVDNSCNENDLCEANLNENFATCPHDCHQGNSSPVAIQESLMAQNGPIDISNLSVTFLDGVATISWETNKPTDATLILKDGMGGTEGGYLDELFATHHKVKMAGLDSDKDYYFRIFSKSVYGDDNFETAQLYLITPTNTEEESIKLAEVSSDLDEPMGNFSISDLTGPSCIIKPVDNDLDIGSKIVPPKDNSSIIKRETNTDFSGLFVNFFNKFLRDSWLLQFFILFGVIFFTYLNFRL